MANREHNTFAKRFVDDSIGRITDPERNGVATETDRSNIIGGAVIELLEDVIHKLDRSNGGMRGRVQRQAAPVLGGGGLFIIIAEVLRSTV